VTGVKGSSGLGEIGHPATLLKIESTRPDRSTAPEVVATARFSDFTVVDLPLFFEAGERMGRVSYDRDGRVAGLFFLPRGLVDAGIRST
jgi:hypothetical protein